jgi:hypothetical protein
MITERRSMDMPPGNGRARRAPVWTFLAGLFALGLFAAPVNAAYPAKTLRAVLTSAEMSFDPQFSADAGSDGIIDHIYDSMLDYDYLARPVKLVPRTLEAMPTIADGGATYVFSCQRATASTCRAAPVTARRHWSQAPPSTCSPRCATICSGAVSLCGGARRRARVSD